MSRAVRISSILLALYLAGCMFSALCMNLYTAFYPAPFSGICFKAGAMLFFLSTFNPTGIVCAIVNLVSGAEHSKDGVLSLPVRIWIYSGPALVVLGWLLCTAAFVHHSGGV